ncbi:MAG: c-type cytochrome domain-containing protein [Phycisphaerales bacterium]
MEPMVEFLGRLHPMVLHAPIGIAIALASLEVFARVGIGPRNESGERGLPRAVRSTLAWVLVVSAGASIGSGLLLHEEGGYREEVVDLHKWLAISAGVLALMAAVLQQVGKVRGYGTALVLMCAVLVPAGHFGASLTHGADFLTEPFRAGSRAGGGGGVNQTRGAGETGAAADSVFAVAIQPIFDRACVGCHGAERQKAGLALNSAEALMDGSEYGPAIIPGDAASSELVRRLRLPLDDEEHMPPRSKAQLTAEEIGAIEEWVKAGAPLTVRGAGSSPRVGGEGAGGPAAPVRRASDEAIAAIRASLVHVEPVSRESNLLVISFAAVAPTIDDAAAERLLRPVAEYVGDLDLARTRISDATLGLVASMKEVRRVNLSATGVTDAGVARLAGLEHLEELILTGTGVTGKIAETLERLAGLKKVYVWKTGLSEEEVAALRARFSGVGFNAGDAGTTTALEVEPELALSSDAPAPGAPVAAAGAGAGAASLTPVNAVCPVSGKAVDAEFALVYQGRVVGFCCKHCVAQFLDDPAKYADKIK